MTSNVEASENLILDTNEPEEDSLSDLPLAVDRDPEEVDPIEDEPAMTEVEASSDRVSSEV